MQVPDKVQNDDVAEKVNKNVAEEAKKDTAIVTSQQQEQLLLGQFTIMSQPKRVDFNFNNEAWLYFSKICALNSNR